jgi:hypothetical protein
MGEVFAEARRKGPAKGRSGTQEGAGVLIAALPLEGTGFDLRFLGGAGDGNRTRMTSLEGVQRMPVHANELGTSLFPGDRD